MRQQIETRTGKNSNVLFFSLAVGAHDTGERVPICDGNGFVTESCSLCYQFLRVRSAAKEAEIAGDL